MLLSKQEEAESGCSQWRSAWQHQRLVRRHHKDNKASSRNTLTATLKVYQDASSNWNYTNLCQLLELLRQKLLLKGIVHLVVSVRDQCNGKVRKNNTFQISKAYSKPSAWRFEAGKLISSIMNTLSGNANLNVTLRVLKGWRYDGKNTLVIH